MSTLCGVGDAPSKGARSPVKDDDIKATREVKRFKTNDDIVDDVVDVDMTIASAPAEVSTPPERECVMEDVVNKPPSVKKPTKAASKPRGKAKSNALASDDDDDDGGDESGSDFDLGDEDDDGDDDDLFDEDMSSEESESDDEDFSESESPVKKKKTKMAAPAKKATKTTPKMATTTNARKKTTVKTIPATPAKPAEKKDLSAADG